ncbi:MAG: hypothetical protein JNM59_03670 [Hyphomonadaceae bacterium]|nr:hypothetical protein [Hyphomonadaceae bacterium]
MRAAIIVATLVAALAGCASAPAGAQQGAGDDASGFPSLRGIPTTTDANTDAAYWSSAENELIAAGAAVRAHPRAQPTETSEDPAAFVEEARRDLERARQSHDATPQ